MLTVNLRHLEAHEIHLEGELPVQNWIWTCTTR